MKLNGTQVIAADRQTVWAAINDPEILKQCIPGCEEMVKTSPTQFEAVVKQRIGPVSATFKGAVEVSDIVEGQSLRLFGEGKGGVAGMAKGGANVTLSDVEGGTQLSYDAEASVAGKLAQLGSRLIDGVARGMADKFFDKFKATVEDGLSNISSSGASASGSLGSTVAAQAAATMGGVGAVAAASASSAASNAVDAVHGSITPGVDAVAASVSGGVEAVTQTVSDTGHSVAGGAADALQDAASSASTTVSGAFENAADGITGVASTATSAVSDTADGVVEVVRETTVNVTTSADNAGAAISGLADPEIGDIDVSSVDGGPSDILVGASAAASAGVAAVTANVTETVRSTTEHAIGTVPEVSSNIVSETVDASADMLDVDNLDIDVASLEGGAAEAVVTATETVESTFTSASDAADGIPKTTSTVTTSVSVDTTEAVENEGDFSSVAKGAAVAAAGAAAAAASGFAARAGDTLEDLHETAKEKVIAAGSDIDEKAAWSEAKSHAGRAADEAGDAVGDAVDAAKAKLRGHTEQAAEEWGEARENASQAVSEAGNAASDAWTAGKGLAAEEAKNPSPGPMGYPWYMWIIGAVVLVLLWILFT